jgi:hypothetical protein
VNFFEKEKAEIDYFEGNALPHLNAMTSDCKAYMLQTGITIKILGHR